MLIGAHVSVAGGVDNAVERQCDVGGNCGQIFTHSPQVWRQPSITADEAERFRRQTTATLKGPWVIHSAYLVNLCTPKSELREQSIASLQADVDAAARLDIPYVNTHLGAHTGAGIEEGLANAASALDALDVPDGVTILVESDAGAGTKLGGDFDELATILATCTLDLGVCLDTAHLFAAGYDLATSEGVEQTITEFDAAVGLEDLACIHLNDSKHACGSHKDEHAHLGEGLIGMEGIRAVVTHPELSELPFIVETPREDDRGFAWNIQRARDL